MVAFLTETPESDEAAVREALSVNLCRCIGYQHVVDDVFAARQAIPMIVSGALRRRRFPQVNFAASGIGPSKVGSSRRNSITNVSASATRSLRAASDVSVPSRKSAPVM
jgi:xanthine dehydrogenase iron-sulfur cluster and FAD-binding subunit A